ncbi:hypothetical protein ABK040_006971 [Willaertia magna]
MEISALPNEIWEIIFNYLFSQNINFNQVFNLLLINKYFNNLLESEINIWKIFCLENNWTLNNNENNFKLHYKTMRESNSVINIELTNLLEQFNLLQKNNKVFKIFEKKIKFTLKPLLKIPYEPFCNHFEGFWCGFYSTQKDTSIITDCYTNIPLEIENYFIHSMKCPFCKRVDWRIIYHSSFDDGNEFGVNIIYKCYNCERCIDIDWGSAFEMRYLL